MVVYNVTALIWKNENVVKGICFASASGTKKNVYLLLIFIEGFHISNKVVCFVTGNPSTPSSPHACFQNAQSLVY